MSINDIAEWAMKNRSGYAFKDYSFDEIRDLIWKSTLEGSCYICVTNDKLVGLSCGELNHEKKTYEVVNIITLSIQATILMIRLCKHDWPDYTLQSFRKNKELRFITPKTLDRMIEHYSSFVTN